jgi:hypothetical protein
LHRDEITARIKMAMHQFNQIMLGTKLSEAEYEDIPFPRAELHYHVQTKGVQVRDA